MSDRMDRPGEFDPVVLRRIQDDAHARTAWRPGIESNLYIDRAVLPARHVIEAQHQRIPLERDTVVVFADDAPLENWGHSCRYLLYEPKDGALYRTVDAMFPPYLVNPAETFQAFHEPIVFAQPSLVWPGLKIKWPSPDGPSSDWYAVLFSGGSNNRHTNDLEFLYRTLIEDYGVSAERIYVLNYDGTINYSGNPQPVVNWPGDSTAYTMPVHGQGTKAELESVFDELKGRLGDEDKLLIHTNNHGGHNGESYLCTYSGPSYGASDFADKVAELPAFHCLMVMMEQCFAGGFNAGIVGSSPAGCTSVASAADEWHTSIGGADFDPFARDWIAALHGATPTGGALSLGVDGDGDGLVEAEEAFDYAKAVKHPHDTPVYNESSWEAGECYLGPERPWWWHLVIRELLVQRLPGPIPEELVRIERALPEIQKVAAEIGPQIGSLSKLLRGQIEEIVQRS